MHLWDVPENSEIYQDVRTTIEQILDKNLVNIKGVTDIYN